MSTATLAAVQSGIRSAAESYNTGGGFRYAIAFDMDTESLQQHYGTPSYNNAYADIKNVLQKH